MASELDRTSICVITATVGHEQLRRCLQSVQDQTHARVKHCVVIDGPEHAERSRGILDSFRNANKPIEILQLPEPTGKDDWICHRIYGALPFLVNSHWICYLDEDNWFEPDHLSSLLEAATAQQTTWAFALRKIRDEDGKFVCNDECESLGSLHPILDRDDLRLVDTNCYLLRRNIAIAFSSIWNRPRWPQGMNKPDVELCMTLLQQGLQPAASLKYTVNYTVSTRGSAAPIEAFLQGNAIMHQRYPAGLPWELPTGGKASK
jgi:hypothetical protein